MQFPLTWIKRFIYRLLADNQVCSNKSMKSARASFYKTTWKCCFFYKMARENLRLPRIVVIFSGNDDSTATFTRNARMKRSKCSFFFIFSFLFFFFFSKVVKRGRTTFFMHHLVCFRICARMIPLKDRERRVTHTRARIRVRGSQFYRSYS